MTNAINVSGQGAIQKVCHRLMREGGSNNIVKKGDKWRRGVKPKTDVTTSKKYLFNIRIRVTLKVVIRPLPLLFNLAFHIDNKV